MSQDDPLYNEKKAHFEEKRERKLEIFSSLAVRRAAESKAALKRSHDMFDAIPFGQPILVGHHSEKADRSYRARAGKAFEKGIELGEVAEHYANKVENLENPRGISSDDPDAVVKLKEKIAKLEADILEWKKIPSKPRDYSFSKQDMKSVYISSFRAEIRRCKKRIEEIKAVAAVPEIDKEVNGVRMFVDKVSNRVKLEFNGKPAPEIIAKLKSHGFHWSSYEKVWMRQISNSALYYAEEILKFVGEVSKNV